MYDIFYMFRNRGFIFRKTVLHTRVVQHVYILKLQYKVLVLCVKRILPYLLVQPFS